MTTFFTSDIHISHASILKFTGRQYQTYWDMNDALIEKWNNVVREEDTVYLLGDTGLGKQWEITKCLYDLKGTIHLIKGNHDGHTGKTKYLNSDAKKRFASISNYKEISIKDPEALYRGNKHQKIVLFHYPIASWNGMHHGSWMLHGHTHSTYFTPHNKIVDVGMDAWGLQPVSYEQIKEYMRTRKFVRIDGEGRKGDYKENLQLRFPFERE